MKFKNLGHLSQKPYTFVQNGLSCSYEPHKNDNVSSILFKTSSGANIELVWTNWDCTLAIWVNGIQLWDDKDSSKIVDAKVRAAVEAGATAWELEVVAAAKRAAQAKADALAAL
jgi:hypothetical protein